MSPESRDHPLPCIATLYKEYLEGKSLRALALDHGYGKKHWLVYRALKTEYGPDCCSPEKVSLLRSLIQDHKVSIDTLGDLEAYMDGGRVRSQRTLDNLSRYKTVFNPVHIEKQRASTGPWDYVRDSVLDFLRLPLYTMVVCCITYELQRLTESPG